MTKEDHLLIILMEECSELAEACNKVAIRASKALRFGLREVQPEQDKANAERITDELNDLLGVIDMCLDLGLFPELSETAIEIKKKKVELFLSLSAENGRLN